MSDQSDFEARLPAIQAIASNDTKNCPMPIGIYAQEAENLYHWAKQDGEALAGAGLDPTLIDELAVRVGVLREAEGRWQAEYRALKTAEAAWVKQSPKAFALRDELIRSFRYAFRHDEKLLQRVSLIDEGHSNADMIQDLTTLAALGRDNTALLVAILFDLSQLELATNTADELAQLLASANGDRLSGNDGRSLRDKAYVYLKAVVDEVRACGKYVFHNNEARLKGYSSEYYRRKNRDTQNSEEPAEA